MLSTIHNRLARLDEAIRAVAPIFGVALLTETPPTVRIDFQPAATAPQQTAANNLAAGWDWTARKPRTLYAIWQAINALTATQQNNVWTDITSGTPPKWATDTGPNAAAIMGLNWSATASGATTANLNDAKRRLVAMYCQDVPGYLVNPSFDATINVAGDEPNGA